MSAAAFLKRNFVVVIGVALPTLLVLFLAVVRGAQISSVPDPRYDLVFASNTYGSPQLEFSVEAGKLKVRYLPPPEDQMRQAVRVVPELFYLDVGRLAVRKIPVELPVDAGGQLAGQVQALDVPQLADLELDPSSIAPDGYRFEYASSSGGLLTGIWGGNGDRYRHVLKKDGRRIKVPDTVHRYDARVVGWVVGGTLKD
jgi:hypothetical protein